MKFGFDPRRSPGRILARHSSNQVANLLVNPWASDPASSGLPAPIVLETLAVPLNHRLGFHDHQDGAPVPPQMRQGDPEQAISVTKSRSIRRTVQDQQLLSQGQILRRQ